MPGHETASVTIILSDGSNRNADTVISRCDVNALRASSVTADRSLEHWEPDLFIFLLHDLMGGGGGETTISFDLGSWSLLILLFGKDMELAVSCL